MAMLVTVRKAEKPHVCGSCRKWIKSGQRYLRRFFTRHEPGGVFTDKRCSGCAQRTFTPKWEQTVA